MDYRGVSDYKININIDQKKIDKSDSSIMFHNNRYRKTIFSENKFMLSLNFDVKFSNVYNLKNKEIEKYISSKDLSDDGLNYSAFENISHNIKNYDIKNISLNMKNMDINISFFILSKSNNYIWITTNNGILYIINLNNNIIIQIKASNNKNYIKVGDSVSNTNLNKEYFIGGYTNGDIELFSFDIFNKEITKMVQIKNVSISSIIDIKFSYNILEIIILNSNQEVYLLKKHHKKMKYTNKYILKGNNTNFNKLDILYLDELNINLMMLSGLYQILIIKMEDEPKKIEKLLNPNYGKENLYSNCCFSNKQFLVDNNKYNLIVFWDNFMEIYNISVNDKDIKFMKIYFIDIGMCVLKCNNLSLDSIFILNQKFEVHSIRLDRLRVSDNDFMYKIISLDNNNNLECNFYQKNFLYKNNNSNINIFTLNNYSEYFSKLFFSTNILFALYSLYNIFKGNYLNLYNDLNNYQDFIASLNKIIIKTINSLNFIFNVDNNNKNLKNILSMSFEILLKSNNHEYLYGDFINKFLIDKKLKIIFFKRMNEYIENGYIKTVPPECINILNNIEDKEILEKIIFQLLKTNSLDALFNISSKNSLNNVIFYFFRHEKYLKSILNYFIVKFKILENLKQYTDLISLINEFLSLIIFYFKKTNYKLIILEFMFNFKNVYLIYKYLNKELWDFYLLVLESKNITLIDKINLNDKDNNIDFVIFEKSIKNIDSFFDNLLKNSFIDEENIRIEFYLFILILTYKNKSFTMDEKFVSKLFYIILDKYNEFSTETYFKNNMKIIHFIIIELFENYKDILKKNNPFQNKNEKNIFLSIFYSELTDDLENAFINFFILAKDNLQYIDIFFEWLNNILKNNYREFFKFIKIKLDSLLELDSDKMLYLIKKISTDDKIELINNLDKFPNFQYLLLKQIYQEVQNHDKLSINIRLLYFELLCEKEPNELINELKNGSWPAEICLSICEQKNQLEGASYLSIRLGNYIKAFEIKKKIFIENWEKVKNIYNNNESTIFQSEIEDDLELLENNLIKIQVDIIDIFKINEENKNRIFKDWILFIIDHLGNNIKLNKIIENILISLCQDINSIYKIEELVEELMNDKEFNNSLISKIFTENILNNLSNTKHLFKLNNKCILEDLDILSKIIYNKNCLGNIISKDICDLSGKKFNQSSNVILFNCGHKFDLNIANNNRKLIICPVCQTNRKVIYLTANMDIIEDQETKRKKKLGKNIIKQKVSSKQKLNNFELLLSEYDEQKQKESHERNDLLFKINEKLDIKKVIGYKKLKVVHNHFNV